MNEMLTNKLIASAENEDMAGVCEAIEQGADVNERGPNSFALHCAAFGGFNAIVSHLIEAGASLDVGDAQGFQPLHLAASKGHLETLKILLDAGAPVNGQTPAGGAPLHIALASGFSALVPTLLEAGADVNLKDANGRSPLMTAIGANSLEDVRTLLAAGADLGATDNSGWSPVWIAAASIEPLVIQQWEMSGQMESEMAVYRIDWGVLRLDDRVLPLDEQREVAALPWIHPMYPKYLAAIDIALELLEHKPKLRPEGVAWNELHHAAKSGVPRVINAVLEAIGDRDGRTGEGAMALHLAATSGRPDGLAILIKACADQLNAGDNFGWTPLHYICDKGGPAELFQLLLDSGADPNARGTAVRGGLPNGVLPIEVAKHWRDDEAVQILTDWKA